MGQGLVLLDQRLPGWPLWREHSDKLRNSDLRVRRKPRARSELGDPGRREQEEETHRRGGKEAPEAVSWEQWGGGEE